MVLVLVVMQPVRVLPDPDTDYTTSWIGNSYSGRDDLWVQNFVDGMFVLPDGTVFANSQWDESGRELGVYQEGAVVARAADLHGWGRGGGFAVTANEDKVYMAMGQGGCDGGDDELNANGLAKYPPCGTEWYSVRAYDRTASDGVLQPISFAQGYGVGENQLVVDNVTEFISEDDDYSLTGLALYEGELFVSSPFSQAVKVYDTETFAFLREFPVESPGPLAFDSEGMLWSLCSGEDARLERYTREGERLPQEITFAPEIIPTAFTIDGQNRLLVTDNGPEQNIKIYTDLNTTPRLADTFGVTNGIYAGTPGEIAPLKFYDLRGVGVDEAGNIYVGMGSYRSGTHLQSYTPDGQLNWELMGLLFVDALGVDTATDGTVLYGKHERYTVDPSKTENEAWTYAAYTLDPFTYPDDPRLHMDVTSVFIRNIQGRRLMFTLGMYAGELSIFRFDEATRGEIAIPSGVLMAYEGENTEFPASQPVGKPWIWRDANGDGGFDADEYEQALTTDTPFVWGWWVDNEGTIWRAHREDGFRRFPLQGFDAQGNPIYTYASSSLEDNPAPFDTRLDAEGEEYRGDINRILYEAETDTMYLTGYTAEHQNTEDHWGQVGRLVVRYDDWSTGNRTPSWEFVPPYDETNEIANKAIDIVGDYMFLAYTYPEPAHVMVFSRKTGEHVKTLTPDETVGSVSGWFDIPYAIQAYQRRDGEYWVLAEEDYRAKVIWYRFR